MLSKGPPGVGVCETGVQGGPALAVSSLALPPFILFLGLLVTDVLYDFS